MSVFDVWVRPQVIVKITTPDGELIDRIIVYLKPNLADLPVNRRHSAMSQRIVDYIGRRWDVDNTE